MWHNTRTRKSSRFSQFQSILSIVFLSLISFAEPGLAIAADRDNPTAALTPFKAGKALYDKGQYAKAFPLLAKAANLNTKNTVYQYYLGLAAAQNGDTATVKRAMVRILIRNDASSPNARQARALLDRYASGCQPYCCTNGGGQNVRFLQSDMPIKIYVTQGYMLPAECRGATNISPNLINWLKRGDAFVSRLERDPNYTSNMRGDIMAGMQKWGWAQGERLFTYQIVNSANDCDIIVFWAPQVAGGGSGGYTSSMNQGEGAKKVVIQVATIDPSRSNNEEHFSRYRTWVGMHEFGHAFGLCGHSPSKDDIMYKTPGSYDAVPGAISESDRATLRGLYDIAPDVGM